MNPEIYKITNRLSSNFIPTFIKMREIDKLEKIILESDPYVYANIFRHIFSLLYL